MFFPDNFPYFLTLFTLSIFCGTYLLFTYYVNRLLLANAILLFMCAVRIAIEFYLPSIDNFTEANQFMASQGYGFPANVIAALQWTCVWFCVRPLKGWQWEKTANYVYLIGFLIIPFSLHSWFIAKGDVFYFNPTKIDNYWQFTMNTGHWYFPVYNIHTKLGLLVVLIVLIIGVIRNKRSRLKQSFLLVSYIIMPILFF